jgi:DNA-binding MltR family transcriptional regulator
MSKKFAKLNIEGLCKDTTRFVDEIQKEPDRSIPIVVVAFLDDILKKLIEAHFIDNQKVVEQMLDYPGALSNFAARADVAYCLGLIPSKTYQDIVQVRKIRNKFSHSHFPVSFDNKDIADMCKTLNFFTLIKQAHFCNYSPREQFLTTAIMLVNTILLKALSVKNAVIPKNYEPGERVKVKVK